MRPVQTAISPHAGLMPTPVFGAALRARLGAITGFGGLTGIGAGFGTGAVGGAGVGVCSPSPPFSPPPGLPCCSSGQLTVIFTGPAVAVAPPSAVAVAACFPVPQDSSVVVETMWMLTLVPPGSTVKVQLRTWLSLGPVMVQPETSGFIDQSRPSLPGRLSVTVTLVAGPADALWTVIVKPILSPESTWLSSAVLVRVIIGGQFTVTVAVEVSWPSLVAAPVAVLLTVAQSSLVVDEVMWTVGSLATPRGPGMARRS